MILRSQVAGCGAYLPERVITNRELAGRLDTSDEWIRQRTGIGERRVAAPGELTSDLALRAAERALASAGMNGSDLDLLVDFEPGASLLDHIGLFQDLEDLLGVGVDVVARSALKTRDDHIRAEAVDL